jgi:hypothetical protein
MMALTDRAAAYVASMPRQFPAKVDMTQHSPLPLIHGFALSDAQAWAILCEYNTHCSPPWSERELRHKLESAGKLDRHPKPRGHLSGITHRHAVGLSIPEVRIYSPAPLVKPGSSSPPCKEEKTPPPPAEDLSPEETGEAHRIAGELLKMHKDGAFTGADDPHCYAAVLRAFGGTYISRTRRGVPKRDCVEASWPTHPRS